MCVRFDLVTFRDVQDDGTVLQITVPRDSLSTEYTALDRPITVSIDGRPYLQFGVDGPESKVLMEIRTGVVVYQVAEGEDLSPVNSSIEQFSDCVRVLYESFPFYSEDASPEETERVAEIFEDRIRGIDVAAVQEGTYWYEVRWSIATGDYATESFQDLP